MQIDKVADTIFESIKHIDEEGREYQLACELQKVLEYTEYRKLIPVINKAKIACENSRLKVDDHFAHMSGMIEIAKGGTMPEDLPTPKSSLKEINKRSDNV